MQFEWDKEKDRINKQKHGVSFNVAVQVFSDPDRLEKFDGEHSQIEDRWITLGLVWPNVLFVVYMIKNGNDAYRIISARRANAQEENEYYNYRF